MTARLFLFFSSLNGFNLALLAENYEPLLSENGHFLITE